MANVLAGSYKRYKEDTNVFTTWLGQAAEACGLKSKIKQASKNPQANAGASANATPRLKGKERKLAKEAAAKSKEKPIAAAVTYNVTTQDLLRQAETVAKANKRGTILPENVLRVLERAINARQRCSDWFTKTGLDNGYSKEGHNYFISVLRKARDLLQPPSVDSASMTAATVTGSGTEQSTNIDVKGDTASLEISNRFAGLTVEEVDANFELTTTEIANTKPGAAVETYEIEVDPLWDVAFSIYCFFEDLQRLQEEVKRTWRRYQAGQVDLMSATLVSSAAIEMVRRAETDMHDLHTAYFPTKRTYNELAMTIFQADSIDRGQNAQERLASNESLRVTPFDSFIYLPTAHILMKFSQRKEIIKKCAWPPPVSQMRFSYISRPELLELPEIKELEREDEILSQLLLEMILKDTMKPEVKRLQKQGAQAGDLDFNVFSLIEDSFARSVRPLWEKGIVTVQSVFASRITLDVLDICRGGRSFHQELIEGKDRSQEVFQFFVDEYGVLDVGGGVRWLTKDQALIAGINALLTHHIANPALPALKQMMLQANPPTDGFDMDNDNLPPEILEAVKAKWRKEGRGEWSPPDPQHVQNAKMLNLKDIRPSCDPNFAMSNDPLQCGTLLLNILVRQEEAGVKLANHHLSIFATAYLYHGLRLLENTDMSWPQLDHIMDIQVGPLFAGEVPATLAQAHSRMSYRLGSSARRRDFNQVMPWKFQETTASTLLRKLLDEPKTFESTLYQLEAHIEDLTVASSDHQKAKKSKAAQRQVTPLQFIQQLEKALPVVMPNMTIDYITLTRTCNELMRKVRDDLSHKVGVQCPSANPGESSDHGFLYMVMNMLQESADAQKAHLRGPQKREPFHGDPQMVCAGETMKKFWRRHNIIPTLPSVQ